MGGLQKSVYEGNDSLSPFLPITIKIRRQKHESYKKIFNLSIKYSNLT